jgi:hypothetical protein
MHIKQRSTERDMFVEFFICTQSNLELSPMYCVVRDVRKKSHRQCCVKCLYVRMENIGTRKEIEAVQFLKL